jgi:hypothetical protein
MCQEIECPTIALLRVELAIWYDPARTDAATCARRDARSVVKRLKAEDGPEMAMLSCDPELCWECDVDAAPDWTTAAPAATPCAPPCDVSTGVGVVELRCNLIVRSLRENASPRCYRCDNSRTPLFCKARLSRFSALW